jgi:hypothetical protein
MKHLKLFNDTASYEAYKNSEDYVLPNVSYVEETKGVSYEPYVAPVILIEFTVEGTPYQAEEGMTWEEFVESSYNDGNFGTASWEVDDEIKYIYYKDRQIRIEEYGDIEPLTNEINPHGVYYYYPLG